VATIPVTEVGKHFKPALIADAAVRAVTDALDEAGLPADGRTVTAGHEHGRLVVTVGGADARRVSEAVAGFALAVRTTDPPSGGSDPDRDSVLAEGPTR
jgi:phosphoglycerate dehydrogenase-like enzyme